MQNSRVRRDSLLVSSTQQPGSGVPAMVASGMSMPDYSRHQFSFRNAGGHAGGGIYGPVGLDKLRSLWRKGMVRETTMVWVSGREHQGGTVATYAGLIDALSKQDDVTLHPPKHVAAAAERNGSSGSGSGSGGGGGDTGNGKLSGSATTVYKKVEMNGGDSQNNGRTRSGRTGTSSSSDASAAHARTDTDGKSARDSGEESVQKKKLKGTTVDMPSGNDHGKRSKNGKTQSPIDSIGMATSTAAQRAPDLSDDNEKKQMAHQLAVVMKKMLMWSINNGSGVGSSPSGAAQPPKIPPEFAALLASTASGTDRAPVGATGVDVLATRTLRPPAPQHGKDAAAETTDGGMQHTRASPGRRESTMREIRRRRSSVMPSLRKAVQEKEMSRALNVDIDTLEKEAHVMEVQVNSMPSTPVFRTHTQAKTATSTISDSPAGMRSPSDKKVTDELVRLLALKQEMKAAPSSAIRKQLLLRAVSKMASPTSSSSQSLVASSSHSIGPFGIARSQYGSSSEATLKALEVRIMVLGEMLQSSCDLLRNEGNADRHAAEVRALSEHYSGLSERFENYKRQNSLLSEENSLVHDEIARLRANMEALSPLLTADAATARQTLSATSSPLISGNRMSPPLSSSLAAEPPQQKTSTLLELQKAVGSITADDDISQNGGGSGSTGDASTAPPLPVSGSSGAPVPLRALIQGQNASDISSSSSNPQRTGADKSVRWSTEHADGSGPKSVSAKDTKAILRLHTQGTSSSGGGGGTASKSTSKMPMATSSTTFYPYRHSRTNYRKLVPK